MASIVHKMRVNEIWACDEEREETETLRAVIKMKIEGKRERGRAKKKRLDAIEKDMMAAGVWQCSQGMGKIETNGGVRQEWPTPDRREDGEREQ